MRTLPQRQPPVNWSMERVTVDRVEWRGSALVLVVPGHRLPELDLVVVGIEDPGELAVLVRLGPLEDLDAGRAQLGEELVEVVDPVVDHEARLARAEPVAVRARDVPRGHALVVGMIVGPPQ